MAKSAQQASFGSILDRAPSEIEKPKPAPVGSYITSIVGQPRYDKSSKKQTEFVEFTHKFISAGDDVDADELKEFLGDRKLSDITMKNTYYLTETALWRVKEFLEHASIDLDDHESLRSAIEATPGAQVGLFINHEPSQDGTSVFARVGKTFVAE